MIGQEYQVTLHNLLPFEFFMMKEDLDILIEQKCRKQDKFATSISAIETLPSPNDKNIALQ